MTRVHRVFSSSSIAIVPLGCIPVGLDCYVAAKLADLRAFFAIAPLLSAPTMHYSVTKHLPTKGCSCLWFLTVVGCALALLDRGQLPAVAQSLSAADVAAPNLTASAQATAAQSALLVDPVAGNDVGNGSDRAPFKTITRALEVAQAGAIVLLSPGTYSQETGETFPLRLKPGVTVQGNADTRGQGIVIQGSGFFPSPTFARQKVAIVGADRAVLSGVTVKNPDAQGYGVWIESTSPTIADSTFTGSGHDGISVTGNGAPLIRNNYFYQNGANGITLYGTSQAEVQENIFEQTGFAININQKATPLVVGNRITQNKDGIVVQANAQPVLRNNSVEGNTRDGLVAIAQSRPNLGTAAAPGGNSFRNNGQFDVNTKGSNQQIPAFGNDVDKTSGTLDLAGTSLGATSSSASPWSAASPPLNSSRLVASSVGQRSPASADKSTMGGKIVPIRAQKLTATTSAIAATPQTIPFGQRLEDDRSVGDRPTSAQGISASAFPVPAAQPSVSSRPVLPLVAVAASAKTTSESGFPVPSALSGMQSKSALRPVPVVRVAIAPITPLQRSPQSAVKLFNAALPTVTPIPRPNLLPARTPIAFNSNPVANPTQPIPLLALKPSTLKRTGAIEIPVPAPEVRSVPSPVRPIAVIPVIANAQSAPLTSAGLLPVPNPDAPIGNVGSASIVYRTQQTNSSAALGLRYRVVVEANDSQQAQLRATFPNAFRTSLKGRSLMQVGAFSDRAKADQLMQTLSSQGVQAAVETLE